ncbi:meiotic recombination protein SPO11-like isoform X2 [Dreissena polymorpha]|uniref:meiotic recombination protein SPO11-like isoform X2 n=1 Tax=Dreissena polymorpha TaxID=45954 RepID=UPI002264A0AA|nr:meiotic recombination protein SPO11-like isoform X2 [Dreissena polymorpha]
MHKCDGMLMETPDERSKPKRMRFAREDVLVKIEEAISNIVHQLSKGIPPTLTYPSTTAWGDVCFNEDLGLQMRPNQRQTTIRFESLQSLKKFGMMLKVLAVMYRLVKTNHYCTKRDLYYQDPTVFGNQHTLDSLVNNIACMLGVPRWHLHVLASSKGCIAGDLMFEDADNNYIDCRNSQMGIQVPNHVTGIHNIVTCARFILVVEKDATFQKLLEDKVCNTLGPCILITGKGFPDVNTRMLLRRLWDMFSIPMMALVDADPHGVEIMTVYKFGSRALAFETCYMAVPSLKWLGLLPSDIESIGIPKKALIPLTKADQDKGAELLYRPYMQHYPAWKLQVEYLLRTDKKAEIQSLDSIGPSFLSEVYLPSKMRCCGWI